jgi:hypothetical protein
MSSKQLTPEDLERMSPQALVEFMTENIPADKLRNCLSKVEEFPTELPTAIPAEPAASPDVAGGSGLEPEVKQIDVLRNKCEKYPVIVVKIDKVPKQTGDFVHFYKKNKEGVFKLLALPVDKFDKQNCNSGDPEVMDADCEQIGEWIESKIKDGELGGNVKTVMEEYVKNNSADFISKCDNVSRILSRLGITAPSSESEPELELEPEEESFDTMSNKEKLNFLKSNCIYKSGILFGDLVKGDPTKATVYMARKIKESDGYEWQRFKISLDNIKNRWCEQVKREDKGTEKYEKFSVGFTNTSPEIKAEIQRLVQKLSRDGIEIPYDFLTAGGSSFGTTGFSTVASMSPEMVDKFIRTHLHFADVIEMKNMPAANSDVKFMSLK